MLATAMIAYLSDNPPIIGITIAREMAKPENIIPIQTPVTLRSSAMIGNIGEIILNPNIAANIEKYRVNNVRFSIILPFFFSSEDIKFLYIKLSVKLDTFRIINKKPFWEQLVLHLLCYGMGQMSSFVARFHGHTV